MPKKDYLKITNAWEPKLRDSKEGIEIKIIGSKSSGTKVEVTAYFDEWCLEEILKQYKAILVKRIDVASADLDRLKLKIA